MILFIDDEKGRGFSLGKSGASYFDLRIGSVGYWGGGYEEAGRRIR
jgi:hypothetical protein